MMEDLAERLAALANQSKATLERSTSLQVQHTVAQRTIKPAWQSLPVVEAPPGVLLTLGAHAGACFFAIVT